MKALTDKLAPFMPSWLMLALSAVMAAALLAAFVDTLHDNLRRGQELRLAQAAAAHPPALQVADASAAARPATAVRLR